MNSLKLEIYCPSCYNAHIHHVSMLLVDGGHMVIYMMCPHCGKALKASYEVRGHVTYVQAAGADYPAMMPLEGQR